MVRRVLEEGQAPAAVAKAFGVDLKTVRKWIGRFEAEGPAAAARADPARGGRADRRASA